MTEESSPNTGSLPLPIAQRVDEACNRFEAAWKARERPKIEDYLSYAAESDWSVLLRELLLLELELRRDAGDNPRLDEYHKRFPEYVELINAAFPEITECLMQQMGGIIVSGKHSDSDESARSPHDTLVDQRVASTTSSTGEVSQVAKKTGGGDLRLASGLPLSSKYVILQEAGRGGMGVVYRALHKRLDKEVAVKVLLRGRSSSRFLKEAKLLAKVISPHVVSVYDCEMLADERPMLCMAWVDGGNLLDAIQRAGGVLPEDTALRWMRETCAGMLAAENQGITHRDLKPSNILIDHTSHAQVADFGLARGPSTLAEISRTGDILGTPLYMAPEQAEDPRRADARSDIYSFGATFYHALTGRPPFEGLTPFVVLFKHKTEPLVSPKSHNLELSERTCELLERCLAKSPGDRFQSFAELLKQLQPSTLVPLAWDAVDDDELAPFVSKYHAQRDFYLRVAASHKELDQYQFPNGRILKILRGDIVNQEVDAIVSSSTDYLTMDVGVSSAIREAAGPAIEHEARRYVPVRPGRAVVTSGGDLPARFVFHGITIGKSEGKFFLPSRDLISEIMASCFYHADSLGVRSIAFPLLGSGAAAATAEQILRLRQQGTPFPLGTHGAGFSPPVCLDTMFRYLARTLLRGSTCVCEARIVLYGGAE